jgi:hypothetical protein
MCEDKWLNCFENLWIRVGSEDVEQDKANEYMQQGTFHELQVFFNWVKLRNVCI